MTSTLKVDQIQLADGSTPTIRDLAINDSGTVLQVVQATNTTSTTFANNNYSDFISVNITPISTSSVFEISGHLGVNAAGGINQGIGARLYVNSTLQSASDYSGIASNSNHFILFYHDNSHTRDFYGNLPFVARGNNSITSGVNTIKLQVRGWVTATGQKLNGGGYNSSVLKVTEIAG